MQPLALKWDDAALVPESWSWGDAEPPPAAVQGDNIRRVRRFAKLLLEGSGTLGRPIAGQSGANPDGSGPPCTMVEFPFTVNAKPGEMMVKGEGAGGAAVAVYTHIRAGDTLWIEDANIPGGGHCVKVGGAISVDPRGITLDKSSRALPDGWKKKPERPGTSFVGCSVKKWKPPGDPVKIEGVSLTMSHDPHIRFKAPPGDALYDTLIAAGVDVGTLTPRLNKKGEAIEVRGKKRMKDVAGAAAGRVLIRQDGNPGHAGWEIQVFAPDDQVAATPEVLTAATELRYGVIGSKPKWAEEYASCTFSIYLRGKPWESPERTESAAWPTLLKAVWNKQEGKDERNQDLFG